MIDKTHLHEKTELNDERLIWQTNREELLLHTPVFDVIGQEERSADGITGTYVAMEAPDWVMTIPVYRDCFVMVRQWRHAYKGLTTEFPGGVNDTGEDPAKTAVRELVEETGFLAGKLTHLGTCSPNPALFRNRFHVYLAEDLTPSGTQHLDEDEVLRWSLVPIEEVIAGFGSEEYAHALMGTALTYYLRYASGQKA